MSTTITRCDLKSYSTTNTYYGLAKRTLSVGSGDSFSDLATDAGNGSTAGTLKAGFAADTTANKWYENIRGLAVFDLSGVPATDNITSAVLYYRASAASITGFSSSDPRLRFGWLANSDTGVIADARYDRTDLTIPSTFAGDHYYSFIASRIGYTLQAGIEPSWLTAGGDSCLCFTTMVDYGKSPPSWVSLGEVEVELDTSSHSAIYLHVYHSPATQTMSPSIFGGGSGVLAPANVEHLFALYPDIVSGSPGLFTPTTYKEYLVPGAPINGGSGVFTPAVYTEELFPGIVGSNRTVLSPQVENRGQLVQPYYTLPDEVNATITDDSLPLRFLLRQAGDEPIVLTWADSITAYIYDEDDVLVTSPPCTVNDNENGDVQFSIFNNAFSSSGKYSVRISIDWGNGDTSVVPSGNNDTHLLLRKAGS